MSDGEICDELTGMIQISESDTDRDCRHAWRLRLPVAKPWRRNMLKNTKWGIKKVGKAGFYPLSSSDGRIDATGDLMSKTACTGGDGENP